MVVTDKHTSAPFSLKLPEHLKNHWKTWGDNMNEKNSISINQAAYDEVKQLLAPAAHSGRSTSAAQPVSVAAQVAHLPHSSSDEVNSWKVSQLLGSHAIAQSALQYTYGDQTMQPPPKLDKGKKRACDVDEPVVASNRKARSCVRCHRTDCDGRFRSRNCSTPMVCVRYHSV